MELEQLLKECRRSHRVAQKQFFDRFAMQMFVVCRRYVSPGEAAEEVMMNGFLKFYQSLSKFEYQNDGAVVSWLKKIMVNECLMHLRANNSFLQIAVDEFPEIAADNDVISAMSADEIFVLITKLPTGYRTVFNLYAVENLPHKEIAQLLGISEGTSKSQLSKAKNLLQQMVLKNNLDYACRKTK